MKHRIVIISCNHKPALGGIQEWVYQVALALLRAGWEVVVIAPEGYSEANEFDSRQPFETIRAIPRRGKGLWTKFISAFRHRALFQSFRHLVENRRVGYTLAVEPGVYGGYLGLLRWLILNGPNLRRGIVFHGKDVETVPAMSWMRRRLLTFIVCKMDDVFCNSHFTAHAAKSTFELSADPVVTGCGIRPDTLPPPVGQRVARRKLDIDARYVLLTIGRLVPRKGIDMVIRSLPEILSRAHDLLYLVAGGGDDLGRLRRLTEDVGCTDHVRFDGVFEDDLLAEYYCAADLFVMPARHIPGKDVEGFGIVYVEAGHYGLPVIGGNAGGVPDVVIDGHTGLLVNPESPPEIAGAILRLLGDPALSTRLGTAGQRRAHNELTWDAVAERIITEVEPTLSRR